MSARKSRQQVWPVLVPYGTRVSLPGGSQFGAEGQYSTRQYGTATAVSRVAPPELRFLRVEAPE